MIKTLKQLLLISMISTPAVSNRAEAIVLDNTQQITTVDSQADSTKNNTTTVVKPVSPSRVLSKIAQTMAFILPIIQGTAGLAINTVLAKDYQFSSPLPVENPLSSKEKSLICSILNRAGVSNPVDIQEIQPIIPNLPLIGATGNLKNPRLLINPDTFRNMSENEKLGVLGHEAAHLTHYHTILERIVKLKSNRLFTTKSH